LIDWKVRFDDFVSIDLSLTPFRLMANFQLAILIRQGFQLIWNRPKVKYCRLQPFYYRFLPTVYFVFHFRLKQTEKKEKKSQFSAKLKMYPYVKKPIWNIPTISKYLFKVSNMYCTCIVHTFNPILLSILLCFYSVLFIDNTDSLLKMNRQFNQLNQYIMWWSSDKKMNPPIKPVNKSKINRKSKCTTSGDRKWSNTGSDGKQIHSFRLQDMHRITFDRYQCGWQQQWAEDSEKRQKTPRKSISKKSKKKPQNKLETDQTTTKTTKTTAAEKLRKKNQHSRINSISRSSIGLFCYIQWEYRERDRYVYIRAKSGDQ